jgi:hypothetical protein
VSVNHRRKLREHPSVDRVGLGEVAHGASEVARLARIDHHHRKPRGLQRAGERKLITAARLHEHQCHLLLEQALENRLVALRLVGKALNRGAWPQR